VRGGRSNRDTIAEMRSRLALLCVLVSSRVSAQKADADAAFQRGRALMASGDVAKACTEFEASMRFDAEWGTLYNLALCHERLGKLATAWTELNELVANDTNAARAHDARKRAAGLEPRLTRMRLTASEPLDRLVVRRDGTDVSALLGQPTPIDPGHYTFVASAPGYEPATVVQDIAGEGATVDVAIPVLHAAGAAAAPGGDGAYPRTLPLRPVILPKGLYEVSAYEAVTDSSAFAQDPFDTVARARVGFGVIEAEAALDVHMRYADTTDKPTQPASLYAAVRYLIAPALTVGIDYVDYEPRGPDAAGGSDFRALVDRKEVLAPNVALEGRAGVLYSERDSDGQVDEFALTGEGHVQVSALSIASLDAGAILDANLGGTLYTNTLGFAVAVTGLLSVTPQLDAYAMTTIAVSPSTNGTLFALGAAWRPR